MGPFAAFPRGRSSDYVTPRGALQLNPSRLMNKAGHGSFSDRTLRRTLVVGLEAVVDGFSKRGAPNQSRWYGRGQARALSFHLPRHKLLKSIDKILVRLQCRLGGRLP